MFQLVIPGAGPVLTPGASYEQIDRGPQALGFPVSGKKNFEIFFLCSYVPTCDPRGSPVLTPGASYEKNLVEIHKEMLHTKYQSSAPSSFREEDF